MCSKDAFKRGADAVGKAAAEKFDQLKNTVASVADTLKNFAAEQDGINIATEEKVDLLTDEVRALKDNKQYIKSSRHSLDDMEQDEQTLVFAWLSELLEEMVKRGLSVSADQRAFLLNLRKYVGLLDESFEIQDLYQLEKMGEGNTHQAIYKMFLALVYLHNASLAPLEELADVDNMFKLSAATKQSEQELLQNRVLTLGIEGLISTYDQERPINSFSVANVLSQHIELGEHPALTWNLTQNELEDYMRAFALLALTAAGDSDDELRFSFSEHQREYLAALGKQLGCQTVLFEMDEVCQSPRNVNIKSLQHILDDTEKKYTWFLDYIFIDSCRDGIKKNDEFFASIAQSIRLDDHKLMEFMSAAEKFCIEKDQNVLISLILEYINEQTGGWKHILNFRGLNLKGIFADTCKKLHAVWKKEFDIFSSLWKLQLNIPSLMLESEAVIFFKRGKFFSGLNTIKDDIVSLVLGRGSHECSDAIRLVELYRKKHPYKDDLWDLERLAERLKGESYSPDPGEDWYNGFERGSDAVNNLDTKFSDLISNISEQLSIFEEGCYNETVEERKRKKDEAKKRAEEEERQTKATATVVVGGKNTHVNITWENWSDDGELPFAPSDLKGAATDGKTWLAYTDKTIYACRDGQTWLSLAEELPDWGVVKFVNEIWLYEYLDGAYYSEDAIHWEQLDLPISDGRAPSVFYDGNKWILRIVKRVEYTYSKKMLVFTLEDSGFYDEPQFYVTEKLGGQWRAWEKANDLPSRGLENEGHANFASNGATWVTVFNPNHGYMENVRKQKEYHSQIMYLKSNQEWKNSDIDTELPPVNDFQMLYWHDHFLLAGRGKLYTSEKGYTWHGRDMGNIGQLGEYNGILMLFPKNWGDTRLYLTADCQNFAELMLPEGTWKVFSSKDDQLLAVWEKDKHEIFLMRGYVHCSEI